jgi:hypothetical protein
MGGGDHRQHLRICQHRVARRHRVAQGLEADLPGSGIGRDPGIELGGQIAGGVRRL